LSLKDTVSAVTHEFPSSPRDPTFVALVAGLLTFATLLFYTGLTPATPDPVTIAEVVVVVTVPAAVAYELARRLP
jgi:hypothetical protein